MDQQQLNDYFAGKMAEANQVNDLGAALSRYAQLEKSSADAYARNAEAAARREQLLKDNEQSIVNRLGIEDTFLGGVVNNAAALAAGASDQIIGNLVTAPANIGAAAELQGITADEMAAYQADKQGKATEEQKALLQRQTKNVGSAVDVYRNFVAGLGDTVKDRIANTERLNKFSREAGDFFDIGSIVNRTGQANLEDDLRDSFQSNWGKVTDGNAADKVAGIAGLLGSAVSAGVNNTDGLMTFLSENIPQLAIGLLGKGGRAAQLATNVGYGLDNFQEGVKEYEKVNGTLPTGEDLQTILNWSAAAAAAEQVGDISVIRGLGKGATKAASSEAAKRGVVASAARTGSATAQGFAGEGATEAFQTFAENQAKFQETTPEDLYVSGAIGGLVGGTLRGGLTTLDEGARAITQAGERADSVSTERKANKAAVDEAIKNNDPSKFADASTKDYAPDVAVDILYKAAQANKDDVDLQTKNLEKANSVLSEATERSNELKERIDAAKNPEVARKNIEDEITKLEAEVATAKDTELAELRVEVAKDKLSQLEDDVKRIKKLEAQYKELNTAVTRSSKIVDAFTRVESSDLTKEQISNPSTPEEAKRVINLAMSAPGKVDTSALESLSTNPNATDTQKAFARASVASRNALASAQSIDGVNTDVLYGNTKTGKTGIQQYRDRVATALAAGKPAVARGAVALLSRFADSHKSKAEVAAQVFADRVASGTNDVVTIAPNSNGVWAPLPEALSNDEARAKGYMNIHRGSNRSGLIDAVQMESQAIQAALVEANAAIDAYGAPATVQASTQPSAKPTAVASATTTPTPKQSQKKTEENVEPVKETENVVVQSEPQQENIPSQTDTSKQIKEETEGGLSVFAKKQTIEGKLGEVYTKLNLVAQYFTQRSSKPNDASQQPLVSVKDFHTSLKNKEVKISDFLADKELNSKQQDAIKHFFKFASDNYTRITDNLTLPREVMGSRDMVQFFVDGSNIDENVKTAIAVAAYTWLAENGSQPNYNDDETIRDMLGLGEFDSVSPELRALLVRAGSNERNLIASMGQKAVASLGLKLTKDAPANLLSTLEVSIGAQAWKLLDDLGYIQRTAIPGSAIKNAVPASKSANYDEKATFYFSSVARTEEGLISPVREIIDAQKGTSSILNKLFGVESSLVAPTLEPVKDIPQFAQGTDQPIPQALRDILSYENSVPNYLRQDTFGLLTALSEDAVLDIAGFNRIDPATLHAVQRDSVQAKNDGLVAQVNNAFEFFREHDADAPIYFEHTAWKQQRVGISTNLINPQTSKFQRFLIYRPEWETKVDLNNQDMVDSLLLRIGEGLKIKTDKQGNEKSMAMVQAKLQDPVIQEAAKAIADTMIDGGDMTPERQAAIVAGVQAGKMQMHSLDALIALAQLNHAQENNKDTITVKLMGEIDGVTNGPMLSHLLMGAGATVDSLYNMLNRGGFYSVNQEDTNYNVWRGKEGNQDLYETTIGNVLSRMNVSPKLRSAFYEMVGELSDEKTGKITGEGRDIIKTPLTAMVFGSSLNGAIDSMFDKFTDTVYERIADAANTPDEKARILGAINDLLREGGSNELFTPKTDLMETRLSNKQINALRNSFDMIIGDAVKDTMQVDFAVFMASRKVVNDAAQAAFKLYDAARKGITEKFIADKMDAGEIAYRTSKGVRQPLHDLTPAMKVELGKLLLPVTPVQATAFSLQSKQPNAGLFVAKTGRQFSRNFAYQGEAHFGKETSTGTKSLALAAYEFSLASPGVAMLVMSVHSTDSAISHNAVMGNGGTPTQVLNVHDAHGSGLKYFNRTATNLNQATWNAMLNYSPATEMSNTLNRTIMGMQEVLKNPEYADAIKPYLKDALTLGSKKSPITLGSLANEMATTALAADKMKYETMALMASVDQYALEGANYVVTDADRKKAADRAKSVEVTVTPAIMQAISSIEAATKAQKEGKKVEEDTEYQNEIQPEPVQALARTITPAMYATINDTPKSVEDSLGKLSAAKQAKKVQATAEAQQKLKSAFSPWGEVGTSNIKHDEGLVQAFEAKPVMNKAEVLALLRQSLADMKAPKNIREFNIRLYQLLQKTAPENLEVRYVTPETSSNDVMGKGASKSRGWYMSNGETNQIYILSTDHKYAGVTPELLLHELTHSVLAGLVEEELANKAKDPSYTSEALELINNLDALRTKATSYMEANNLGHLSPATSNIHEFISWGMTNLEFQRDVLSKISTRAAKNSNSLISGMKAFIKNVVGILFRNSDKSTQARTVSGLTQMVTNTSGLFYAASQKKSAANILLNQESVDPLDKAQKYTAEQIYEAITDSNPNNQPSAEFDNQLRNVLGTLVSKIHDPMGVIKEIAQANQTLTALDVYTKALSEGKMPFASKAIASGFKINNQEAFVMEQVEATIRAALTSNEAQTTAAYSELRRVYEEARKNIKPMDFLESGVTEATATAQQKQEATDLWNAAFNAEANAEGRSEYIAQFVALALANEQFASKLGFDARRKVRDADSYLGRIQQLFDKLVNFIFGKLTKTSNSIDADDFVKQLAEQLVEIEAKRRVQQTNTLDTVINGVEERLLKVGESGQEMAEKFANTKFFKNSKNGFVRFAGLSVSLVAAPERVHGILDGIQVVRNKFSEEKLGILSSVVDEMNGLRGSKEGFLKLLLQTKNIERERARLTGDVGKAIKESFAKKEFTKEEQRAITSVFLRTDLASLVGKYSDSDVFGFVSDSSKREAEIKKLESALRKTPYANIMLNQSIALGYFLATGVSKHPALMMNAHNIARMGGTTNMGKISEDTAVALEADIDSLVSLYALRYSTAQDMKIANEVLKAELARKDKGNGIETIIKIHKELQRDSKDRLFENNEALVIKGYLPEVTNPYITFKVADEVEGIELMRQGYTKGKVVGNDPADPTGTEKHLYVLRDGGNQRFLTSLLSYTGNQRKGSSNQRDNSNQVGALFNRKEILEKRINSTMIDPLQVQDSYMVPVLNNAGQVVNYRYMMSNASRDNMLERDNRFEHLLGTMAGNTFDKATSPEHNKLIMESLKAQYDAEQGSDAVRYFEVSAKSADPELREFWNMLPEQTKKDVKAIWGEDALYVRNDMLDLVFGYRKKSLSTLWDKETRSAVEQLFVDVVEHLVRGYAYATGKNPDDMATRAKYIVRKGEDVWQAIVAETKDIIVVRTGTVLWGNILSNFSVLGWYGVPIKEMVRHHRVAIKAASEYQRDMARLTRVETMLATDALEGNDRKELEAEVVRLQDALNRNPVKELIDAGLMPTIVEDLESADDIYSYKSALARGIDEKLSGFNPKIRTALNWAYMGKSTPMYQALNRATQLSDFVARYTLYNHLIGKEGMTKEQAVIEASDAFVNYDIPTHRSMQYLNDMGLLMFTKYYLRIQRVILRLFQRRPVRGMLMALLGGYVTGMETLQDSNMLGRLGNNPFSLGALRYPSVLDDLATVNAAVSMR